MGRNERDENSRRSICSGGRHFKIALQFTPASADDYLILAFAENVSSDTKGYFGVRLQVYGTTEAKP